MTAATLPPVRKTRMARPMTPVRITARYRSLSTGHYETWAAVSADGAWSFERLDMPRTPWRLTHVPTGRDCGWFGSLPKARRAVADGSALEAVTPPRPVDTLRAELTAMGVTAESPVTLDPEAEYLYRREQED